MAAWSPPANGAIMENDSSFEAASWTSEMRVDAQTGAMDGQIKTATEARQAAFAARSQTDPKNMANWLEKPLMARLKVIWACWGK